MHQTRRGRLVASAAATVISLACGTNYVYSAWAPQFAEKLGLSATQSNLIGLFGNLGMYSMGVPIGLFVDHQGSRPAVIAGAFLLLIGYIPLHQAFDRAAGSVALLCFFSYLTGLGGCMAFAGAVKTSALNWPCHRGTATAFPLAGFGLSAFLFSTISTFLFPGNPGALLMLLSCGTFSLTLIGLFFLRVYTYASYAATPSPLSGPQLSTHDSPRGGSEPGTSATTSQIPAEGFPPPGPDSDNSPDTTGYRDYIGFDEASSLVSSVSAVEIARGSSVDPQLSSQVDVRGVRLLLSLDFWQLFSLMAILAGTGIMTINNIGNNVNALWKHYDDSVDKYFLVSQQQMHVSILSICSFLGRLLSGIGSDLLIKKFCASRVWCLVIACLIFILAQVCAIFFENPRLLGFISSLSGLGYGVLFGVFPSIVAETFGIRGLSQNWGFTTLAPVASSNIFNLLYGRIFDHHSVVGPSNNRSCDEGLRCYRAAYYVTFTACTLGLLIALLVISYQRTKQLKDSRKLDEED